MTDTPKIRLGWDNARVVKLKNLWLVEGLSASHCAARLGGTSRDAVLGKLHRLGLLGRRQGKVVRLHKKPTEEKPKRPRVRPPRSVFEMLPPAPPAANDKARKSLLDLDDCDCRFPVGDVGTKGFGFCAKPRFLTFPYCESHIPRAYVITTKPQETQHSDASVASAPQKEEVA